MSNMPMGCHFALVKVPHFVYFPSLGPRLASLIGTIGHDIVAAECHLKLDSDHWSVWKHARNDGTIAQLLCSGYRMTLNRDTWEVLSSGPVMKRLTAMNLYVKVKQHVKKERSGNVSVAVEDVNFGPLLDHDSKTEGLKLVWPSAIMNAKQTAESLSLPYKDQNHAVCQNDPRLTSNIFSLNFTGMMSKVLLIQ